MANRDWVCRGAGQEAVHARVDLLQLQHCNDGSDNQSEKMEVRELIKGNGGGKSDRRNNLY